MNAPITQIEVTTTMTGFKVYGRFGAVLVADQNKVVTYSNLVETSDEYKKMSKKLKSFKG